MTKYPLGSTLTFIKNVKQIRRALDRSIIGLDEFASNVRKGSSLLEEPFDDATARAVADLVAGAAIPLVLNEIEKVLSPDYRLTLGRKPSEEVLNLREQLRAAGEARMIEVASALKAVIERRPTQSSTDPPANK
jgi:hypothetical protein